MKLEKKVSLILCLLCAELGFASSLSSSHKFGFEKFNEARAKNEIRPLDASVIAQVALSDGGDNTGTNYAYSVEGRAFPGSTNCDQSGSYDTFTIRGGVAFPTSATLQFLGTGLFAYLAGSHLSTITTYQSFWFKDNNNVEGFSDCVLIDCTSGTDCSTSSSLPGILTLQPTITH